MQRKDENKEKRPGTAHFSNTRVRGTFFSFQRCFRNCFSAEFQLNFDLEMEGGVDEVEQRDRYHKVASNFKNVFLNGPSTASFSFVSSFQTNITFLQQIYVKKFPSSIWCWDLNPQSSEHESSSIATRPGLPPNFKKCFNMKEPLFNNVVDILKPICVNNWHLVSSARIQTQPLDRGSPPLTTVQGLLFRARLWLYSSSANTSMSTKQN